MFRTYSLIATMGILAVAAQAADVEEVAQKLGEAQAKVKTYSAKFKDARQVSTKMKSEGQGTFEWARAGETVKFRMDVRRKSTHDLGGEKMVVDENRTTLADGKFDYQINNETKTVLKQKFDPKSVETFDVWALLTQMENEYNEMKVLKDEKVGGHDCYVIEASGTYMEDDPEDPFIVVHKEVVWLAKDTGFPVKMEAYDKDGKVVRKTEFGEIKKDGKIDDKRFEFKAEGMVVDDRSGD